MRRTKRRALPGKWPFLVIAVSLIVSACSSSSEVEDLEARIAELEAQIEANESDQDPVSTTVVPPTSSTSSSIPSTTTPPTTAPLPSTTSAPTTVHVIGPVTVLWYIDSQLASQTQSPTCESIRDEYTVEIRDGSQTILNVSELTEPVTVSDERDEIGHSIECSYTYHGEVEEIPVYSIAVADRDEILVQANLNLSTLVNAGAPEFLVFFSCITGVGCEVEGHTASP